MNISEIQKFTIDEHVSYLKRSSLPTVIVEGSDDIAVYRFIERIYGAINISVLPVGGRSKLIGLYERRNEIDVPLLFIADRDHWCIVGVPKIFISDQIFLTTGYSIENDVIIDGAILDLLTEAEDKKFRIELNTFIDWYALALDRHFRAANCNIDTHPNALLDDEDNRRRLTQLQQDEVYPQDLRDKLAEDPLDLVRGKSLFAILMRQLSYPGRLPKHHHLALMEMVGAKPGLRIEQIYGRVSAFFGLSSTLNGLAEN